MGLFDLMRPKWRHSDPYTRKEAVEEFSDSAALKKVALTEKEPKIRRIAVKKLTDQKTLSKIACSDPDRSVRLAAAKLVTNQAILLKILREDKIKEVQLTAANNLNDQNEIVAFIETVKNKDVQKKLIAKLKEPSKLKELATNHPDAGIRMAAIRQLVNVMGLKVCDHVTDEVLLTDIAIHAPDQAVRSAAAKLVKDPYRCRRIEAAKCKRDEEEQKRQNRSKEIELQQLRAQGSMQGQGCPFYENRLCTHSTRG